HKRDFHFGFSACALPACEHVSIFPDAFSFIFGVPGIHQTISRPSSVANTDRPVNHLCGASKQFSVSKAQDLIDGIGHVFRLSCEITSSKEKDIQPHRS